MPRKKRKTVRSEIARTNVCSLLGAVPGVKPETTPGTSSYVGQEAIPLYSPTNGSPEACIMSEKVSIMDPIMLTRIEKPVRGIRCEHGNIFDRDIHVAFNQLREKRKNYSKLRNLWSCPHCSRPTPERSLVDLPAFAELLATLDEDSNIDHVIVTRDGTLSLPT